MPVVGWKVVCSPHKNANHGCQNYGDVTVMIFLLNQDFVYPPVIKHGVLEIPLSL